MGKIVPIQLQKPHPPILIGLRSQRMRRFAAREGDGWIPSHLPPKNYKNLMDEIIEEAEKHGKRRNDLTFAFFTRILTGDHMKEVLRTTSKEQIAQVG